ncbi:MAG: GMC family oxidoreductase [Acidobacteriota bacterium]|nr:GMC family oxidoreductase [Acidobacteriota bacterium]
MADKIWDVIIVGSGANGGWAAKQLCEAGLEVLMVEAGRDLDPPEDFSEHVLPYELPLRGRQDPRNSLLARRPIGRRCYACEETNADFFIDEVENPYTAPKNKPFWWIRPNRVGGRTLMWGRQSYRMSDYDFKAASHDGYGDDWPLAYEDLAPYYDTVERFIGVSGREEGLAVLPDGQFLPPMAYSCGEKILKEAVDGMGRRLTIGRAAVNTVRHQGRAECHYCGPCHRGCLTGSYFSSPVSTLPAAIATGKFNLVSQAMVHRVVLDGRGRAESVLLIDKTTGHEERLYARIVVLAASTLASTRILFNSHNPSFPDGLANSSGVLGHYLMDHVFGVGASGVLPLRQGVKPELANRPNGIYVPRFRNLGKKEPGFIRGYGFQGGERVTVYEHAYSTPGFGAEFKESVRGANVARLSLSGFAEMLPRFENRCYLDPDKKDQWGIPALRFEVEHGDNERALVTDLVEQAAGMLEAAGVEEIRRREEPQVPGFAIHEVGTARMGDDPETSVVNPFNQTHDVKNLYVMDGSSYVSIGCVNPTLTMMALTVRACDHLIDQARTGGLA